jgi:hypothetical protein
LLLLWRSVKIGMTRFEDVSVAGQPPQVSKMLAKSRAH